MRSFRSPPLSFAIRDTTIGNQTNTPAVSLTPQAVPNAGGRFLSALRAAQGDDVESPSVRAGSTAAPSASDAARTQTAAAAAPEIVNAGSFNLAGTLRIAGVFDSAGTLGAANRVPGTAKSAPGPAVQASG